MHIHVNIYRPPLPVLHMYVCAGITRNFALILCPATRRYHPRNLRKCMCACNHIRVRVRVFVCACLCVCICACVCVCVREQHEN